METLYGLSIGLSLGIILLFFFLRHPKGTLAEKASWLKAGLLGSWFIATIFFGPLFAVIRVPGVFDITIERALFIGVLIVLIYELLAKEHRNKSLTIELLMLFFCCLCLISMTIYGFLPKSPQYASPWFIFINGYFFPFIIFLYAKYVLKTMKELKIVLLFIFCGGLYLSLIAPFEFYGMREYVYPQYINDQKIWLHLDRARGPFQNAAVNGIIIVYAFLCGMYLLSMKKGIWRVIHILCAMIFTMAVFFSQTRSVYLAFFIVSVALILFYRMEISKWKAFFLPVCIFLIISVLNLPRLASEDRKKGGVLQMEEVNIRFGLIQRSIAMLTDSPLTGLGFGQFIPSSVERYKGIIPVPAGSFTQTQHNHLLGIAAELGLPGITVFSLLIGIILFRASRVLVELFSGADLASYNLSLVLTMGLMAYLINNMFIEPSYFLALNSIFYFFAGIIDKMYIQYAGSATFESLNILEIPLYGHTLKSIGR